MLLFLDTIKKSSLKDISDSLIGDWTIFAKLEKNF